MSAPAIIVSAPQGWVNPRQKAALQVEFSCSRVVDDWHPSMGTCPGALHLTSMHPGDLEDFGIAPEDIHRRGWPCARDLHRPQHTQSTQAGNIYAPLLGLLLSIFAAVLLGLILGSAFHLDALTIADHSTELAVAQDLEQAQRQAAARARHTQVYRAICGNADWEELGGGAIRCLPRRGIKPYNAQVAEAQP